MRPGFDRKFLFFFGFFSIFFVCHEFVTGPVRAKIVLDHVHAYTYIIYNYIYIYIYDYVCVHHNAALELETH